MDETTPEIPAGANAGAAAETAEAGEIVVRRAEVVASRRGAARLLATRLRSAVETARRLARNPAVVAGASAVGAVALREGVALARRAATREVATRQGPASAPVVVVVNVLWFVHEHRLAQPAPSTTTLVRIAAD